MGLAFIQNLYRIESAIQDKPPDEKDGDDNGTVVAYSNNIANGWKNHCLKCLPKDCWEKPCITLITSGIKSSVIATRAICVVLWSHRQRHERLYWL